MPLFELLNKYHANATVNDNNGVVSLEFEPEDDHVDEQGFVTDPTLKVLDDQLDQGILKTFLATHPSGQDGGYVLVATLKGERAWYDQTGDCEWKQDS